MRLYVILLCMLAMAWGHPLLKRKLLHSKIRQRIFGVNTHCKPCGRTFTGKQTVQPMDMAPIPGLYAGAYTPLPQLYGELAAAPNAGNVYNSREYSSGQMNHFTNVNGVRTHHFRNDKRPAPVLNYASQHHTQVEDAAAATSAVSRSSSTLWPLKENAHVASSSHHLAGVHGGDADTFGAVPPVPVGPTWIEGEQYIAYSPLDNSGEVVDNSAAVATEAVQSSAAAAWSHHKGNYRQSNGHSVAFAHASSTSWSSNNSG